ncbi:hypothetical protein L6249_02160 [Candidatus Parcubacteria bacterium]|nr:hypothetical protein [Patescibacteria group bacterium]MBU4347760.1 hypothetical protein [Patescibacteria group bacterium]MCG2690852.1 hypothetical protein [Candidatus Parcubacteria bacterium]
MADIKKRKKEIGKSAIDKDIKELVKARLSILPQNVNISIGLDGAFKRDELIRHVEQGDSIGEKIIQVDMEFLRSLKRGEFYE